MAIPQRDNPKEEVKETQLQVISNEQLLHLKLDEILTIFREKQ